MFHVPSLAHSRFGMWLKSEPALTALVERWSDSPNFQYFSGQAYFEPRLPCDATTLVKVRRLLRC